MPRATSRPYFGLSSLFIARRAWPLRASASRLLLLLAVLSCSDAGAPGPVAPRAPSPGRPSLSGANVVPTAQFAVTPRWPAVGDTVTFDARYSHDSDGSVTAYRWAFSNGITNTTGAVTREVFRTAGTYTVTLTTYDDGGDSTSTTLSLPVGPTGTPAGAVSASQSRLTLSASSTTGGTAVTATVTAKTSAGVVISAAPVAIAASGLRVSATPNNGTTNGAGVWTSSLKSGVAQSVVVRAAANFTALTDTALLTVTPAASATVSTVRMTQSSLATLGDSALVEVTVKDTAGNALSGINVGITASPAGVTVSNEGVTDANGRRIITVKSSACATTHTLTISVGGVALGTLSTLQQAAAALTYSLCGAVLWLDASDATSIITESGSRITQWRDKSGYARHANATTGSTARPTYTLTTFNGRPSVTFAGGTSGTSTPEHLALSSYPGAGQSAMTWFVVHKRTVGNSCDRLFDFGSSTTVNVFLTAACATNRYSITTTGSGGEVTANGGTLTLGATYVNTVVHGSTAILRTNGVLSGTSAAIGSPSVVGAPTNNWLGRSQYPGDPYFGGEIAEVLAFPRTLTALEYAAVEKALMIKWGIGTLTIVQGNSQTATAGTATSVDPQVRITDAAGNGIAGATTTWVVSTGGGRINGAITMTATTDASGYVSVPNATWKLDYGTNVITVWYGSSAGIGQSVTFSATGTLPANLVMQYDADDGGTLYRSSACTGTLAAVGDSVGCWKDNTGNVRHVTQATAANRPTVTTFGSTGRTAIQFVKTRENYLETTAAGIGSLADGAHTMIAAAKGNTTEDNSTNDAGAIAIFPGYHSGLYFAGYPSVTSFAADIWESIFTLLGLNLGYTANTAAVTSQVISQSLLITTNQAVLNGSTSTSTTAIGYPSGYGNLMRIGQANVAPTTSNRWRLDGQVAELMIFSRALNSTERLQVERYMGWKWGITVP